MVNNAQNFQNSLNCYKLATCISNTNVKIIAKKRKQEISKGIKFLWNTIEILKHVDYLEFKEFLVILGPGSLLFYREYLPDAAKTYIKIKIYWNKIALKNANRFYFACSKNKIKLKISALVCSTRKRHQIVCDCRY